MDPRARFPLAWKEQVVGKPLTDRKISAYEARGFYSTEFRQARRDYQAKKKAQRKGNFDVADDGRLIYRPL